MVILHLKNIQVIWLSEELFSNLKYLMFFLFKFHYFGDLDRT